MDRVTAERLDELLDGMRQVRVLVVGDLMLDVYLRGSASRISPEAPVPVVRIDQQWRAPGGAANVAANVVALGASCDVVGAVGPDESGMSLRTELDRIGIAHEHLLVLSERATTVKTRIMARRQQIARYDIEDEGAIDDASAAELSRRIADIVPDADAIVIEDYDKGVLVPHVVRATLAAAEKHGKPVVVDPKARAFFAYRGATVFKPNEPELAIALQGPVLADDPAWLRATRDQLGCENLLVTLGERGMSLMTRDDEHVRVPAVARSVYDVSGAGDTVSAVLATALACGAEVAEAAVLANHAAGVEVAKTGVATVTPDELRAALRRTVTESPVRA